MDIKDFIHICAVIRFTAQIEISNPQIIFIIHMSVLWQVKSINYQTIHNLSHIDPNCLINQELKMSKFSYFKNHWDISFINTNSYICIDFHTYSKTFIVSEYMPFSQILSTRTL